MFRKTMASVATVALLGFGVAACGEDEKTTTAGKAASAEPVAKVDNLTGQTTAVALDAGFVEALGSLKVTPGTLGDGKLKDGSLIFPITGGNVTYYKPGTVSPYVQGVVNHEGSGFSLEAGGKKVDLENFVVDPGTSTLTGKVSVDGEVAAESAPLFFLDGRTLNPLEVKGDNAILEGTTVKLKQEAADLLNSTFGIEDLQAGLVIGVATITINAK